MKHLMGDDGIANEYIYIVIVIVIYFMVLPVACHDPCFAACMIDGCFLVSILQV